MKLRYTFLYVEDEETFRDYFIDIVNQYFHQKEIIVTWQIYDSIPKDIDYSMVDACFFDVKIKEECTLDIVKENIIQVPVVFISQYDSYIYEGVHFNIFDYIMKDQLEERIEHTLSRIEKYYEYYDEQVVIQYDGNIYRIKIGEIDFIKTLSHHIVIYKTNHETIEIWKGYNEIFDKDYTHLLRVHKSYVVNVYNCYEMKKKDMYFVGWNEPVTVSHRKYKEVKELFLKSRMNRY